jgi:hypothetical protein
MFSQDEKLAKYLRFLPIGLREGGIKMDFRGKDFELRTDSESRPAAKFY